MSNGFVILLVEVFYLTLLIFPSIKTSLKGIALLDAETFHLRPDSVFLVFSNTEGAAV